MPFLRAALIKREREVKALEAEVKTVGKSEVKGDLQEAIREMEKMNCILKSVELALAGLAL